MNEAILKIYKNEEELNSVPLHETMMIGRKEDCGVRLEDRAISREHAFLRVVDEGIEIKKKSQFGEVKVNGKDVTHAIIGSKDIIEIGPYRLSIHNEKKQKQDNKEEASSIEVNRGDKLMNAEELFTTAESPKKDEKKEAENTTANPNNQSLGLQSLKEIFEQNTNSDLINMKENLLEASVPDEFSFKKSESSYNVASKVFDQSLGGQNPESQVSPLDSFEGTKPQSLSQFIVTLKVLRGNLSETEFPMKKDRIVIGRSSRCDITLPEKKCSRENTEIYRKDNKFFIKDLGSSNGTRVNGIRIEETQLYGNENILVGDTEFKFEVTQKGFQEQHEQLNHVSEEYANVIDFKTKTNLNLMDPLQGVESTHLLNEAKPTSRSAQGILGIGESDSENKELGLFQKLRHRFKTNDRFRLLVLLAVAVFFLLFLFDEEEKKVPVVEKKPIPTKSGDVNAQSQKLFENLSPADREFVVRQRDLAFDLFKNEKYDEAIFEIDKVFQYVDDYSDAKTLRLHSLEGKRLLESKEEEKRIAELEKKIVEEIRVLELKANSLMDEKKFNQLESVFSEILSRQPENENVPKWRQEIRDYVQQEKDRQREMLTIESINKRLREQLESAHLLRDSQKYLPAINEYQKVIEKNAPDKSITEAAKQEVFILEDKLKSLYDARLSEGKEYEESGELALAYKQFEQAQLVDPRRSEGQEGMKRVFGALEEKAKVLYTEAVVAESLSDFTQAKKKFNETLEISPSDSIYHERSQRKLARYKNFNFE